ncbi:hypothetical protein GCM10012275_52910 [Longimycelium tulufanense]|uniref:Uncharacterized protein n=1 Tax=Longimycelium tulufanense TaxID=907463 RepID=A0A8J3FYF9_9PSEU|nr:hypothetical protein GCM10012275_52910 [Longimycelium tulufanense]
MAPMSEEAQLYYTVASALGVRKPDATETAIDIGCEKHELCRAQVMLRALARLVSGDHEGR